MNLKKILQLLSLLIFISSYKAQTFNYYYGNIHSHTAYSDGDQDSATSLMTTPIQAFNYAKNSQQIDFYGISEHNHASAGMKSLANFHKGIVDANTANADGSFVAIYGFEWGVISGGGHVIVYGTDSLMGWDNGLFDIYVPQSDYPTLWKKVNARPNTFAYLCHPSTSDYGGILTASVNTSADSAIVGMAGRSGPAFSTNSTYSNPSTSTYITQYNYALRQGYHVGVGLDHDTHNSVFGRQTAGRLVAIAPYLTRAYIYDAFHKMRFYCSDDWNVKVNFQIQNQQMGSIITHSGTPTLSVTVTDPDFSESIASIAVYHGVPGSGSNPTVLTSVTNTNSLVYTYNATNNTKHYFYLLITEADGDKIWTSPIWYNRNDSYVETTPVANFTESASKICINQPVLFNDMSTNAPTSWTWTASGANPAVAYIQNCSFTFTTSGTYTVGLTASNGAGVSSVFTKTINVLTPLASPTISVSGTTLTAVSPGGIQWYVNNYAIPGATVSPYVAPYNGVYSAIATDPNYCNSSKSNTVNVIGVGIETYNLSADVKLFPNPSNGLLTLEVNGVNEDMSFEVFDEVSRLVYSKQSINCASGCSYDIDLSALNDGIYFVKLSTAKSSKFTKLIVNKH